MTDNTNKKFLITPSGVKVPLDENGDPMYGETFDTWQTELKDGHEVEYLPIGKYLLVQNTSADVTVKAEPVEFEVTDTAEQQAYGMVNKYAVFDLNQLELYQIS